MNLRVAIASVIVLVALLVLVPSAKTADVVNVFSGQWTTTLYDGSAGSVTFKVVSDTDGAAGIEGLGGHACGAPTTYYRGDFSDEANPHGVIYGCIATAGHMIARYKSDRSGTDAGDLDITFAAPDTFSGHFTYQGSDYAYSGKFVAHTPDDGCCPSSGGTTGGGTTGGGTTGGGTTGGGTTGGGTTGGGTTGGTGGGDCGATAAAHTRGLHHAGHVPPEAAREPSREGCRERLSEHEPHPDVRVLPLRRSRLADRHLLLRHGDGHLRRADPE